MAIEIYWGKTVPMQAKEERLVKSFQHLMASIVLICSAIAQADSPASPRQYSITSANGVYEFTMYTEPSGHAYRIDASDDRERLWTVSGWYSFTTFLSDDGRHLVRMGPWASLPPEEELAVAFYRDGTEYRRHTVADLVDDIDLVERSVSHYIWQGRDKDFPRLAENNRFQILTVENRIVTFDLDSGEILSKSEVHESNSHQVVQITREQADDTYFAQQLFARNGIEIDIDLIGRVLRGPHETVVWTNGRFADLPVFYHEVGYSFDANGRLDTRAGSDQPLLLGSTLPPSSAFPIDHRPDVTTGQAIATYQERARDDSFLGYGFTSPQELEAVLGFHNILIGRSERPEYRIAWRVRPRVGHYPVAMIGAKKGDVLFFDSGMRSAGPITPPAPTPPIQLQPELPTPSVCHDAVQDKIAWDRQGQRNWNPDNVRRLCAGNEHSEEPAICFAQAMHGGVDRGDESDWTWRDALRLCSGARDAEARISCFSSSVSDGIRGQQAIAGCSEEPVIDFHPPRFGP